MKKLVELYYRFFTEGFNERITYAKNIQKMIAESTKGSINHFYGMNGEKIRGYSNDVVHSRKIEHPLIAKYK